MRERPPQPQLIQRSSIMLREYQDSRPPPVVKPAAAMPFPTAQNFLVTSNPIVRGWLVYFMVGWAVEATMYTSPWTSKALVR
jgi:hypothetical protein